MTVLAALLQALRDAAAYNTHELAAPRVILWPDEERLWAPSLEALRSAHPAVWSLGTYAPHQAAGPAAWLRFQLDTYAGPEVPVLYLPGVGRAAFRSVEQCPLPARHLYALQFQGQFWTQKNGKDWTPFAFLSSTDSLDLDVAGDQDTKRALQECLPRLLAVEVAELRGRKLEAADFRAIITQDPVRTLLRWLGEPAKVKQELEQAGTEWSSFRAICRDKYHFDPDKDGAITAAEKLTSGKNEWALVWGRYKEAPRSYPGVRALLATLPPKTLFDQKSEYLPISNEQEEARLEADLLALATVTAKDALERVKTLAADHAPRAGWVWAALGESPLARASGALRDLAELVQSSPSPTTWSALAEFYSNTGWRADAAVLRALAAATSPAATKAITAAVRALYQPWLERFALLAQNLTADYPVAGPAACRTLPVQEGTVYLFADGLRLDLARGLEAQLTAAGLAVEFSAGWAALPTVTATAKPAWQPLAGRLGGPLEGPGFESREKATGKPLTHARFKQLLVELGVTYLEGDAPGLPTGCAWTEFAAFDKNGHDLGARLAGRVEEELTRLRQRIQELLTAGWARVRVVTDHGWLMLPGGLPKTELPKHLTQSRWGRCASLQAGALHSFRQTPWFWDGVESVVLAPGIACFMAGVEYTHGGLTMQEALIPALTVAAADSGQKLITVQDLKWAQLRLNVVLAGAQGLTVDIRTKAADAGTSLVVKPVTAAADGQRTSLLVAEEDALGTAAMLVVIGAFGQVIFKQTVTVGEN